MSYILLYYCFSSVAENQLKTKKALRKKLADFEKAIDQFNPSTKMVQLAELVKEKQQTLTDNDKIVWPAQSRGSTKFREVS